MSYHMSYIHGDDWTLARFWHISCSTCMFHKRGFVIGSGSSCISLSIWQANSFFVKHNDIIDLCSPASALFGSLASNDFNDPDHSISRARLLHEPVHYSGKSGSTSSYWQLCGPKASLYSYCSKNPLFPRFVESAIY